MDQKNQLAKATSKQLGTGGLIRNEITNGVAIRRLDNTDPLKIALQRIFVLVGVRQDQLPNSEQTRVLIDFCLRRYGNYTANEFVIAFEMAISGDFNAELDHFGQFTAKYISGVLNAYIEHRNKIALQVQIEEEKKRKEESPEEAQEKKDIFFGEAVDIYRNSSNGFEGSKYHANVLYDELKKQYTREELIEFKRLAGVKMKENKQKRDELKNKYLPIPDYLQGLTFSKTEWKRQTALLLVNDALIKNLEI